jgi:hypothetical protein
MTEELGLLMGWELNGMMGCYGALLSFEVRVGFEVRWMFFAIPLLLVSTSTCRMGLLIRFAVQNCARECEIEKSFSVLSRDHVMVVSFDRKVYKRSSGSI